MPHKLIILGSGGYGHTVADIAEQLGYLVTFLDDAIPGKELNTFSEYISSDTSFIPAFGNNLFRLNWLKQIEQAGGKLATLIHPSAYVSPKAVIEEGAVILPKAVVNTNVIVEKGCIINLGAIIDHGCVIEEGCHICIGAIVKGENRISSMEKVEAGEVIEAKRYPVNP